MTAPLIITGSVRSGTTMFRLMLGAHSQIADLSEVEYCVSHLGDTGFLSMDEYRSALELDRMFMASGLAMPDQENYKDAIHAMINSLASHNKKQIPCMTIHSKFHRAPDLWPDARYIFMLRDGRDVALSCQKMGWAGNTYYGADHWVESIERYQQLRQKVAPNRIMLVRYEDLLHDVGSVLERVCEFLGVSFEAQMLNYNETSTYGAPDVTLSQQWRRKQSNRQVQLAEARMGPLLGEMGYGLSGLPPLQLSAFTKFWLRFGNRLGRAQASIRRYGLGLWLKRKLFPLVGGKALMRKTQQQINQELTRTLK